MAHDHNREDALNEIRQNITEHGFHIYAVAGSGKPHYGYTIGLNESLGLELILAGAYYYRLNEVEKVIRSVVKKLRTPIALEAAKIEASPWGVFTLRKVDQSWAGALMLGALDYYKVEAINAYQILPDQTHWTNEIPDLSQPWSPRSAPAWRWSYEPWPYPVPRDSVALTNLDALRGGRITEVMRWEEDEWEIFAGAGPDTTEAERRMVPLGVLLTADASLLPVVDLHIGTGLWRDADSEWHAWRPSQDGGAVG